MIVQVISALTSKFSADRSFLDHIEKLNVKSKSKYVPSLSILDLHLDIRICFHAGCNLSVFKWAHLDKDFLIEKKITNYKSIELYWSFSISDLLVFMTKLFPISTAVYCETL